MPAAFRPSPRPLPAFIWFMALLTPVFLIFPVLALLTRVPWQDFAAILAEPETLDALKISLWAGIQSTIIAVILAIPLGAVIHAIPKGRWIVRLLVFLPLALPPVVAGLALTSATKVLDLPIAFTFPAVVIAHVFVIVPYATIAIDTSLGKLGPSVLIAAESLGISTTRIFFTIVMPAILPGVFSAGALSFARSLGEFGTTVTFAGSFPGVTRTITASIYLERELHPDRALVLAAVLIGISLLFLLSALIPHAFMRRHQHRPARLGSLDTDRLQTLCEPEQAPKDLEVHWQGETYRIPAGRVTAIVGPNGSGKSTLAGLIVGSLVGADVYADSTELSSLPLRQRGIAIVPQQQCLPPTAKVEAAVAMALPTSRRASAEAAHDVLDSAGLQAIAATPVPALSGGQSAQVALTRALATRPSTIILDEPFAPLDTRSRDAWHEFIRAGHGSRTIILITHSAVDVERLADWVIIMKDGRLTEQGTPDEPAIAQFVDNLR